MRIAIDASRANVSQRTGTEGYSLQIIRGLLAHGMEHEFILYFREEPAPDLFPLNPRTQVRVLKRKRVWTHGALGPAVRADKPDVLFVPSHVVPWPGTGPVPSVVTIHDLGYLHYPEKHPPIERTYLAWSTRYSVRVARQVIAVSQVTRHDLIQLNRVPQDKIRVIYSGVDDLLRPISDQEKLRALRARLGIPEPYILHVGSVQPRKNLDRLIEAFGQVKDIIPDLSLVLAGRAGWRSARLMERITRPDIAERIIVTGYVPDLDLPALYSGAAVYAFPSLYEGFGFPALEAMACGTPVVCANSSSLPEIAGDAALTFAPTDTRALAEALARLLTDAALRDSLREKGFQRVQAFTWQAAARETLSVLVEAAGDV